MKLEGSIVTFGESLMRLSPPNRQRLRQAQAFDLVFGGAEANVAVSLALLGLPVQYVTRLPENDLGLACLQSLRQYGIGTEFVQLAGERIGIYFLEVGSGERPSKVIYDRAHSSFASIDEGTFPWQSLFSQASWLHWSGINPAVSPGAARATAKAVEVARQAGLTVSCDLNYRHKLWRWGASPAEIMPGLVGQCDLLAANTAYLVLGLPDLPKGSTPEEAIEACTELAGLFPNLKQIVMTCRESVSAVEQRFTAVLWHENRHYVSPAFSVADVVDRVGAGDAFMAGLIYSLVMYPDNPQRVINFAAAAAVMKHTVAGDANLASAAEIEQLLSPGGFDIAR